MELEIDYPFVPCAGASFKRADNDELINVHELSILLNDTRHQQVVLDALGIEIREKWLSIRFCEIGKAYLDPTNDRTKTENEESEMKFCLEMNLEEDIPDPLHIVVELGGWVQENVNFLGRIIVRDVYSIPLTGRGTAALEGKPKDCHAGFCTGGACASFQERAALILAISLAAGASNDDLRMLADEFAAVDARYHGRRDILDYTLHCCLYPSHEATSYRSFMIDRGTVNNVMETLLYQPNAIPGPEYFDKVRAKLSEAELRARVAPEQPAVEEGLYPVVPRPPDIPGPYDLSHLAKILSYGPTQSDALKLLGFDVSDHHAVLTFSESGRAYLQPQVDRQLIDDHISEMKFQMTIHRTRKVGNLPIKVDLGGWMQDNVNFLGQIKVMDDGHLFLLPLTGRGTAALEGKRRDAHSGFCTGGACASFQVRAALCLAIARAMGASDHSITELGKELFAINDRYHGRSNILSYTIKCALAPYSESYLSYMNSLYSDDIDERLYPLFQSIRDTGRPHRGYFEALHKKYSTEELDEERQAKASKYTPPNVYATPSSPVRLADVKFEDIKKRKVNTAMDCFTKTAITLSVITGVVVIIVFFSLRK